MKKILTLFLVLILCNVTFAQNHNVIIPTETGLGPKYINSASLNTGFFFSPELNLAYSVSSANNFGLAEIDVTGGYRFGEYFRAGLGLGVRVYINSGDYRVAPSNFAMPLFVNFRGNFIPSDYRTIVPYWSVDTGVVFPDGFLFRPSVGIRIGQERSAFLLALTYTGNAIRTRDFKNIPDLPIIHRYRSFLGLKFGYEF